MSPEPMIAPEMKFCVDCGQKILRRAEICPHCGCRQMAPPKSKPVAALGLERMRLIAGIAIVCYLIVSRLIDAITDAVSEQGLAPVLKFLVIGLLLARGVVRQIRGGK